MKRVIFSIATLLLAGNSQANECVALIQNAMYDHYVDTQNSGNQSTFRNKICTKYNEIKQREMNTGADVNIFDVIKVDNATYNTSDFKKISKSMCEGTYSHNDANSNRETYKKFVNPRALASFDTCVKRLSARDGLVANTIFDSQFSVSVTYRATGTDTSGIDVHGVSFSNLKNCSGELIKLANSGEKLPPNHSAAVTCEREERSEAFTHQGTSLYANAATIHITTSSGDVFRKLPAMVAGPSETQEIIEKIEEIRIGNVPKGSVVPWIPNDENWIFNPNLNKWELVIPTGYSLLTENYRYKTAGSPYFLQGLVLDDLKNIESSRKELIGKLGGQVTHGHSIGGGDGGVKRDRGGDNPPLSREGHRHSIGGSSNIPPYIGVIFLRKEI